MDSGIETPQTPAGRLPQEQLVLAIERRRETVLRVIRSARERLRLSLFRCSDYLVQDELAEAIQRGVRVEALLTPRTKVLEARRLKDLGLFLESIGADVYHYSDPVVKYHAKYLVADDGPAIVSSLNFTEKCFSRTCDFLLVTHDPAVVSGLKKLFETDCVSPEADFPEGLTERLIVGPDRARAQFTALLEQARRSIRLIDHKVADPTLVNLLKEKREAGVTVEILGSGQVGGLQSHGKMLVVDESVATIGSIALAPLSLDFRREVAVVLRDSGTVSQLNVFFQEMATAPQPPSPQGATSEPDTEED